MRNTRAVTGKKTHEYVLILRTIARYNLKNEGSVYFFSNMANFIVRKDLFASNKWIIQTSVLNYAIN